MWWLFACVAVPTEDTAMVEAHNEVRSGVGVGPLAWSSNLASTAQSWSDHLAGEGCALEHSGGEFGENLYWTSDTEAEGIEADVVAAWAAEVADYDYATNTCAEGADCGHYTQVVWADSTEVGCGAAPCAADGGQVWTCNYDPPGNWVGESPY